MGGSSSSQNDRQRHQQVERSFQQIHQHKEQEKARGYPDRIQIRVNQEAEALRWAKERLIQKEREAQEARNRQAEEARIREANEARIRETKRVREQEAIRIENEKLNTKPVHVRDTLFGLWCHLYFNRYLPVRYIKLSPNTDSKYEQIYHKISNKQNFIIDRIEKIENPLLEKSYELRKMQKKKQFPQCQERLMFHGIKAEDVDNVCTFNFNWRLVEKDPIYSFGNGISFSSNSKYASDNCSDDCYVKVMLYVKVLIGSSCPGNRYMVIPQEEFDTSMKSTRKKPECDDIVSVKYDDGDFYPAYKIHYHLLQDNVEDNAHKKKFENNA